MDANIYEVLDFAVDAEESAFWFRKRLAHSAPLIAAEGTGVGCFMV